MASNSTHIDNVKKELLVFGWIRKFEKNLSLSYDFPEGIINIIMLHYPTSIFKFKQLNGINISDDGLTLNCKGVYHTMRFGEFLFSKDKIIFEVVFDLKQANSGNAAIGFMSSEYDEKMEPAKCRPR